MYRHIGQLTILNDNHHPYQHDPYFLTPCRHQKPYHPVSSLLDEIRSWPVSKMPYHYSYIGRNQWPSTEDVVCHKSCSLTSSNHLRYSQLWYIGRLRSTFQFKIMAQFVSPHFSFGMAAWAASILFLIHHSRNVPFILEGFCLMEQFNG